MPPLPSLITVNASTAAIVAIAATFASAVAVIAVLLSVAVFIADTVCSAKDLCDIFLAILPLALFERVAQLTEKYCYDDWVVEQRKKDSDGNKMKATYFVPVLPLTDGAPTPNRCHRADKERLGYHISAGFIITWIGILVLQVAHVGSEKRTGRKMWQKAPYGLSLPYALSPAVAWANLGTNGPICMIEHATWIGRT